MTDATSSPRRCEACGKAESDLATSLRRCTRCKLVRYCDRDCQRSHWKEHKVQCNVAPVVKIDETNIDALDELFSMGSPPDPEDEAKMKEMRRQQKNIRQLKKEGSPILCMSLTKHGVVSPGFPVPDGVPANFGLKQQALLEFHHRGPVSPDSGKRGNMKGELAYKQYYDDIATNEGEWMEFLGEREHSEHAEHTCGILGTLATIYRQRGALDQCEAVLDMEEKVMARYEMSIGGGPAAERKCFDGLRFKYQLIRFNLCVQTKRYDKCVELYRHLLDYELRYKLSFDDQSFLFMVTAILNKKPTAAVVNALTDREIMKMVMAPVNAEGGLQATLERKEDREKLALQTCSNCGKVEEAMLQFKKCQRCEVVYYCGRICQKQAWKKHKKVCVARVD